MSSDQQVVDDADITIEPAGAESFAITITGLDDNTPGTTTITITLTDGSFTYSDVFTVTTQGVDPVITWTGTELESSAAITYQWYLDEVLIDDATAQGWEPEANGNYTVEVSDADGCTTTSAPYFFGSTGLVDHGPAAIRLYPQPAHGQFFVSGVPMGSAFRLVDALGRCVAEGSITQEPQPVPVDQLAVGLHVLMITGPQGISSLPVVVE